MERNTLMAQVYPRLKDYCREKHGLEFQVILHFYLLKRHKTLWKISDCGTSSPVFPNLCRKPAVEYKFARFPESLPKTSD